MTVDDVRRRARQELGEVVSMETADYLLDRPPGGWGDLATKADLAALETRLDRRFGDIDRRFTDQGTVFDAKLAILSEQIIGTGNVLRAEMSDQFRMQTWRLITAMLATMSILVAALVAAVRL